MQNNFFEKIALLVILCSMMISFANSCDCLAAKPEDNFNNSAAVFAGSVTAIHKVENKNRVTFSTTTIWKGPKENSISILTDIDPGMCELDFQKGKNYLVYAYATGSANTLSANMCSRTALLENACEDLQILALKRLIY
jgi:hypothetical protein